MNDDCYKYVLLYYTERNNLFSSHSPLLMLSSNPESSISLTKSSELIMLIPNLIAFCALYLVFDGIAVAHHQTKFTFVLFTDRFGQGAAPDVLPLL